MLEPEIFGLQGWQRTPNAAKAACSFGAPAGRESAGFGTRSLGGAMPPAVGVASQRSGLEVGRCWKYGDLY